jgi:hypothetical protein
MRHFSKQLAGGQPFESEWQVRSRILGGRTLAVSARVRGLTLAGALLGLAKIGLCCGSRWIRQTDYSPS